MCFLNGGEVIVVDTHLQTQSWQVASSGCL